MRPIVINRRSAISIVFLFVLLGIRQSQTADNDMDGDYKIVDATGVAVQFKNLTTNIDNEAIALIVKNPNDTSVFCPSDNQILCSEMTFPCIRCNYNYSCIYGREVNVSCSVLDQVLCQGDRSFIRPMNCRYCYQTDIWQQICIMRANCNSVNDQFYRTNCTVHPNTLCLGNRSFTRNLKCNWTGGYRWSTALIISLTLGGFGADRFYLGHWQEGIGKLFSFGGLGVWTVIDVLLISLHYLGPADGSLYM